MDQLEDTPIDIIKKAREGSKTSIRTLSDRLQESIHKVQQEEEGKAPFTRTFIEAIGLSYDRFIKIVERKYVPHPSMEALQELKLKFFPVEIGGIESNCYILTHGHYSVLVDSVGASKPAMAYLKEEGVNPIFLLITHGHFDHIGGIETLQADYPNIRVIHAAKDMRGGQMEFECSGFRIEMMRTPGHTEDSVCYLINCLVAFVGDTIFAGSVGRPNYSYEKLLESIRATVFEWPKKTLLCPGHGPITTVEYEMANNPFFNT